MGDIPLLTDSAWHEVIETSHSPNHPYTHHTWAGEVTKVTMVSIKVKVIKVTGL
jgi:hypothetical protein